MTATLLCFLLLTFACARMASGAVVQQGPSIILGFKQYYGDPPKQHLGVDVAYRSGADLSAPVDGTISFIGRIPGSAGLNVTAVTIKQSDGSLVTLNPFATTTIVKGDSVYKGQTLGTLSATGDPSSLTPHAHLSLRVGGVYRDPSALIALALDPAALAPATQASPTPAAPTPAPVVKAAPIAAAAPAPVAVPSSSIAPAGTPAAVPVLTPNVSPLPESPPVLTADPIPEVISAPADGLALTPTDAGLLKLPLSSATLAPSATPVSSFFDRVRSYLGSANAVLRFSILFSGALVLSATVYGAICAARRVPELMQSARELAFACLQSAMCGVTMVSRTFLLRIAPSGSGATSPKEVI
ncbi:MAG: M23 family metallopeptidase [Actinomycetia bacterium]|nr:M23 family metallopeptidase [Actinomycetes bacterium]